MTKKIEKIYAFVITDEKGEEGIPAFSTGPMFYPCVASDKERINSIKEKLITLPMFKNKTIKLLEFSTRTQIDEFTIIGN